GWVGWADRRQRAGEAPLGGAVRGGEKSQRSGGKDRVRRAEADGLHRRIGQPVGAGAPIGGGVCRLEERSGIVGARRACRREVGRIGLAREGNVAGGIQRQGVSAVVAISAPER